MPARRGQVYRVVQDLSGAAIPNILYYVVKRGESTSKQVSIFNSFSSVSALTQPVESANGIVDFYAEPLAVDIIIEGKEFSTLRISLDIVLAAEKAVTGFDLDETGALLGL